ncbi:MAG TPA: universal stress protein [Candidatus Limnocylindria bacterium]|jgi:universal stress protein A|nr:universal stress protein [Candidatus Limnocylindria bacterium]
MKAKPAEHPGEVIFELNRTDEAMMNAATDIATPDECQIQRILVPLDFSAASGKALDYAISMAREHRAAITLLHVIPPPPYAPGYGGIEFGPVEEGMRIGASKDLAAYCADIQREGIVAEGLVRVGSPGLEIVEAARSLKVDLIVISTHGRSGLKHLLMGSVAEVVVRQAPCPVLVVREKERDFIRK